MDTFSEQIKKQVEKNEQLIAEAKETIQKMRDFWKSLGADLDSGENIFLNSPHITPEGRRQVMEVISKMEKQYEARYQQYRAANPRLTVDEPVPETFQEVMKMKNGPTKPSFAKASQVEKRRVKKMRIR
ncbi:MAG: hypothetical protein LBB26_02900 [Puniceicoccales bacterium]|jgi:hypothetical protein|nr:hypothetical protein [Puniceicoccales bacterium]